MVQALAPESAEPTLAAAVSVPATVTVLAAGPGPEWASERSGPPWQPPEVVAAGQGLVAVRVRVPASSPRAQGPAVVVTEQVLVPERASAARSAVAVPVAQPARPCAAAVALRPAQQAWEPGTAGVTAVRYTPTDSRQQPAATLRTTHPTPAKSEAKASAGVERQARRVVVASGRSG